MFFLSTRGVYLQKEIDLQGGELCSILGTLGPNQQHLRGLLPSSFKWPRSPFWQGSAKAKFRGNLLTLQECWPRGKFARLKNGLEGWVFIVLSRVVGLGGRWGWGPGEAWRRGSLHKEEEGLFGKLGQPVRISCKNLSKEFVLLRQYNNANYPNQGQKSQYPCYSIWFWDSPLGLWWRDPGNGCSSSGFGVKDNPTPWPVEGQWFMPLLWTTRHRRQQLANKT